MRKYQTAIVSAIILTFFVANFGIWFYITRKCGNNYSGTSSLKMIDVSKYLPYEQDSDLAHIDTDIMLEGELPVLDGAAALVPVYASVIDNIYPEGCVTYEGGVFSDDNYYGENFAEGSAMRYRNTVRGFEALVNGDADIFFTAQISSEQMEYAGSQGVELVMVPIGLEAFVFFVNDSNPVTDLTTEQIRNIYNGTITNWAELGGPGRPINPLTRIQGSGSQTTMEAFMGQDSIAPRRPESIFGAGIGYSFRFYLTGMVDNPNIQMLSINGVAPTNENIRNGSYPIISEFYVVYRADNTNPNVDIVVNFLLSDEGAQLIEACGYTAIEH
ncbi:MAG: substrate-binding domain-containing protein [Saccharofermentans sp.]|nr:substrate-binding domain-containing protein [Saccharofermentans sp.]